MTASIVCGIEMNSASPIGVFDSGVGGLSVLRHIHALLPHEALIYVADSGHAPYGRRPREYIEQRAIAITEYMVAQGAKAIVVACNTATAAAVATLRSRFNLPIIGMEPAVKPASTLTRSGVVGVLATTGTLESDRFSALVEQHAQGVEVIVQCCVGLVEQVEKGAFDGGETRALVEDYVQPLLARGVDTLVLGCTHYPFVEPVIRAVAGEDVSIVDTGPAVARHVKRRLEELQMLNPQSVAGKVRFLTSGDPDQVVQVVKRLWDGVSEIERLPV